MDFHLNLSLLLVLLFSVPILEARTGFLKGWDQIIRMPGDLEESAENGTRWAVLVAGSQGYGNYRHQADVCHAYQILKKGGLKDENIVVFMYDDIADNDLNPRPGVLINHPQGDDVYAGVPKLGFIGLTGAQLSACTSNFKITPVSMSQCTICLRYFWAISAVKGGSGKVVDSKPNDRIFLYYSDHGGPGVLGMPNMPFLYGVDLVNNLKKKHEAGSYKEMVLYIEACESGSVFDGMMPDDIDIYVTTASDPDESSYGTYCPGMDPPPPPEYITCLGDLYSVAWMEDSETHNLKRETLEQQYNSVKERTSNYNQFYAGSHVMQYGNKNIKGERVYLYQGFDPATENLPPNNLKLDIPMDVVNQRDADLLFLWHRYKKTEDRSENKAKFLKEITETMRHRNHLDSSMEMIGVLLFGPGNGPSILSSSRQPGLPIVDDWTCLKSMVRVFEQHCGSLTQYGMKHMRAFANICNNGVSRNAMEEASIVACSGRNSRFTHPSEIGYSA